MYKCKLKNKFEETLLKSQKKTDILKKQTKTKPQQKMGINSPEPGELFSFRNRSRLQGIESILGLTRLDVYKNVFKNSEENIKNLLEKIKYFKKT